MATEAEKETIELAFLYKLRLTIMEGEKEQYTKEEIAQLFDQIAVTKKG
ncbi:MAG: hypothetical protein IJT94_14035 [Oscillibacter sp.]|nr:hypothetical protein [Oscillibacter sp.]